MPAGALTLALLDGDARFIGVGVLSAGLLSILIGSLAFGDEPPEPADVLERVEQFNRKL